MKLILKVALSIVILSLLTVQLKVNASENSLSLKGYITNKKLQPVKLKILNLDNTAIQLADRDLEDNSISPILDLKLVAETSEDNYIDFYDKKIFIPKNTKFVGKVSRVTLEEKFNKNGSYNVDFKKIICPDKKTINLKSAISSKSNLKPYSIKHHLGKTSAYFFGGALAGTLLTYELGGLGLIATSHGYSLAAGAAAGGLFGSLLAIAEKGKPAMIQPGEDLNILLSNEKNRNILEQISCNSFHVPSTDIKNNIDLKLISVKKNKSNFGEQALKIKFNFHNYSKKTYKINHFLLKDSQGKEYFPNFSDFDTDMFLTISPGESSDITLDYYVDFPKAKHWLILKDKDYNLNLGEWELDETLF